MPVRHDDGAPDDLAGAQLVDSGQLVQPETVLRG